MRTYPDLAAAHSATIREFASYLTAERTCLLVRRREELAAWIVGGVREQDTSLDRLTAGHDGARELPVCFKLDFRGTHKLCWKPAWAVFLRDGALQAVGALPATFELDATTVDSKPFIPHEHNLFLEGQWHHAVRTIQERIAAGDLQKAVLSRQVEWEHLRAWPVPDVAASLLEDSDNSSVFAHRFDSDEIWVGASPEILYSRAGRQITVDSLAGTRRTLTTGDSFTDKDREEQAIVTRYVEAALEPLCAHVSTTPLTRRAANGLEHVYAQVNGVLKDGVGDDELLATLHPTPAVCGAPREAAAELLAALEPEERDLYGGVLGYSTGHATTAIVVLRCAKLRGALARIYGGAGIVKNSDPELEYAECGWKIDVMRRVLLGVL